MGEQEKITNELNWHPKADRVFIKRDEAKEMTSGGLYIPEIDKDLPTQGVIISVGPKCESSREGQRIAFGKHHGIEIVLDGEEITMLREGDIYAFLGPRKMTVSELGKFLKSDVVR